MEQPLCRYEPRCKGPNAITPAEIMAARVQMSNRREAAI